MKTIKNLVPFLILVMFFNTKILAQDCETDGKPQTIEAIYDGMCSDNYSFMNTKNPNEADFLFFETIAPKQWKKYKLDEENFKGRNFRITYVVNGVREIDDDGDEQCYSKKEITFLTLIE